MKNDIWDEISSFLNGLRCEKINRKSYIQFQEFTSELRAYCQGYVDCIQLLAGLGILKQSPDIEKIINGMK